MSSILNNGPGELQGSGWSLDGLHWLSCRVCTTKMQLKSKQNQQVVTTWHKRAWAGD